MDVDPTLEPITIDPNEQPRAAVLAIFQNALVEAATTITEAAKGDHSVSRLASDNARYVVEYVMGKGAAATKSGEGEETPERLLEMLRQDLDIVGDEG
jgi:hypothetical protein